MSSSDYIVHLSFSSLICSPNKCKTSFWKQFAGASCTKHLLRVTVVTWTKLEQEHCCYYACANLMCDENKHKHTISANVFTCREIVKALKSHFIPLYLHLGENKHCLSLYRQLDFEKNHYQYWLQPKFGDITKPISLLSTQEGWKNCFSSTSICWLLVVREGEGRQRTWPSSQYQHIILNTDNCVFGSCVSELLLKLTLFGLIQTFLL